LPFLKPILTPAALNALQSGNMKEDLKQAVMQTVTEALPGVLERGSQAGIKNVLRLFHNNTSRLHEHRFEQQVEKM